MDIKRIIEGCGFSICHQEVEEERPAKNIGYDDLGLCDKSIDFLRKTKQIHTLWSHQHTAIKKAKKGLNVCVTTSTSSGKTEIFILAALERLDQCPGSKILAVYPMKALNAQQKERWEKTGVKVGKIDGSVDMASRVGILQDNDIVVMTPDTIHAYLLKNTGDEAVRNFIQNISMVIIDELHLYKGLFGTNSAYLFRRLNNVRRMLQNKKKGFPQYITASATMPQAVDHSANITGVSDFVEIDISQDGSPSKEKTFLFIEKIDNHTPLINCVANLAYALAKEDNTKSLTFVEGRQRTGEILNSSIDGNSDETGIYPFRAGYEKETADRLTERLKDGRFRGIISTSALEIGLDIEGLNIVIIADMPHDWNSYMQRIGRCGRYNCEGDSYVIIVKDPRSFASKLLFEDFNYDMKMVLPDYEPALYLDDPRIMATHAWLHVGKYDSCECAYLKQGKKFDAGGCFPEDFVRLCNDIDQNQIDEPYKSVIDVLSDEQRNGDPHINCSLRFFGKQFKIFNEFREDTGEKIDRLQVANEAYPGAVRWTFSMLDGVRRDIVQRVDRVSQTTGEVYVRTERNRRARTTPDKRISLIPNLRDAARHKSIMCGDASIYNLDADERIVIYGYKENDTKYDSHFELNAVKRTATIFFHPSFQKRGVSTSKIAMILFEIFLRRNAFDRNDINHWGGKLRAGYGTHMPTDKIVAIYDATDFNMTQRIIDEDRLVDMFTYLRDHLSTIAYSVCDNLNKETYCSLEKLCGSILENPIVIDEHEGDARTIELKKYTDLLVVVDSDDSDAPKELKAKYMGRSAHDGMVDVIFYDRIEETTDESVRDFISNLPFAPTPISLPFETCLVYQIEYDRIKPTDNTEYEQIID